MDAVSSDRSASPALPVRDVPGLPDPNVGVLRGSGGEPSAGSGGDERGILSHAAALRFPRLSELQGGQKIDALIDFITETAIARDEVEELRLEAHTNLLVLRRRWQRVLPGHRFSTKARADDAKRAADPQLASDIEAARWLVDRCTEQINRLGGSDYDAASRAYTLLS